MSVLVVVITAHALGVPFASVGIGFVVPPLLFYVIYIEDRRSVSPEDRLNEPVRTALVTRYSRGLLLSELIALCAYEGVLVYHVFGAPRRSLWFLLLGHVPFVVLSVYDRLKRVPSGDSLSVGATWAYICVFAIVLSTGHALSPPVAVAFSGWLLVVFAGVESRNVQDAIGDSGAQKTTLSGHLGPQRAKVLEVVTKSAGVLVFWALSGAITAGMVVGYLLLLRSFRLLTRRAEALIDE
jgi:4-hydroxybenzoate polyprenyltransferase